MHVAGAADQSWVLCDRGALDFSIYLEAVTNSSSASPIAAHKNVDTLTGNYVFLLGGYRALYLLNWIYRFLQNPGTASGSYGCQELYRQLSTAIFLLLSEILAQQRAFVASFLRNRERVWAGIL